MLHILGIVLVAMALASCGGDEEDSGASADGSAGSSERQSPEELWGRSFVSTGVIDGGEPKPLVRGTRLRISFVERDSERGMTWRAGCNTHGADVEVDGDVLVLDRMLGTEIGCRDELAEQDDWLARFFAADPGWQLSDDRLTLTSGSRLIELEELE